MARAMPDPGSKVPRRAATGPNASASGSPQARTTLPSSSMTNRTVFETSSLSDSGRARSEERRGGEGGAAVCSSDPRAERLGLRVTAGQDDVAVLVDDEPDGLRDLLVE